MQYPKSLETALLDDLSAHSNVVLIRDYNLHCVVVSPTVWFSAARELEQITPLT